jgi:hypothetical protein
VEAGHERNLAELIDEQVRPLSFKRVDPTPVIEGVPLAAAWKYKTLNMNRGIALVTLSGSSGHPGELARSVKKPVGKGLGYIPCLYDLGLQLILLGRGVLVGGAGLHRYLDVANTGTVVLQSIHLVDTDAKELIRDPSVPAAGLREDLGLPGWAETLERLRGLTPGGMLMKAFGLPLPAAFEGMKARLNYSRETGRAAVSVRTFAQFKTGPFIDAIEEGIDRFLANP